MNPLCTPKGQGRKPSTYGWRACALSRSLPSLRWLDGIQEEMRVDYRKDWFLRFVPVPPKVEHWWPPLVFFSNRIARFTDLDTYYATRNVFLMARISEVLWSRTDISNLLQWCYGSAENDDSIIISSGGWDTLSLILQRATGFSIPDLQPEQTRSKES